MSAAPIRIAMLVLAALGIAVSAYLTYVHYADAEAWCTALSDCTRVQQSEWATPAGVPVALLGLLGYLGIVTTLMPDGERARLAGALLAFTGFGYSAYLTSVEAFRLEAWCQWCVVSAALMTALAVLAAMRVMAAARSM